MSMDRKRFGVQGSGFPPLLLKLPPSLTAVAYTMAVKKLRRTGRRASRVIRLWILDCRFSILDFGMREGELDFLKAIENAAAICYA